VLRGRRAVTAGHEDNLGEITDPRSRVNFSRCFLTATLLHNISINAHVPCYAGIYIRSHLGESFAKYFHRTRDIWGGLSDICPVANHVCKILRGMKPRVPPFHIKIATNLLGKGEWRQLAVEEGGGRERMSIGKNRRSLCVNVTYKWYFFWSLSLLLSRSTEMDLLCSSRRGEGRRFLESLLDSSRRPTSFSRDEPLSRRVGASLLPPLAFCVFGIEDTYSQPRECQRGRLFHKGMRERERRRERVGKLVAMNRSIVSRRNAKERDGSGRGEKREKENHPGWRICTASPKIPWSRGSGAGSASRSSCTTHRSAESGSLWPRTRWSVADRRFVPAAKSGSGHIRPSRKSGWCGSGGRSIRTACCPKA